MNAEDCPEHCELIDIDGPDGIYYPWVCECPDPPSYDCPRCKDTGIDPEYSYFGDGPSEYSMGEPPALEPCVDCCFQ